MSAEATPEPPVIRVVRGNPTPVQVAALVAVLAGGQGAAGQDGASTPSRTLWTARSRFARPRPSVGPDGWRASALPR
ncbi:acyl-CoA carboxylase subunit epsilon [Serinicoccus kebangsaanensis]|uniref:acyl-CoA carboxylase subunit epsilon n=1 Tax=Serinicoccus kebangsaanensis TaxID=2602069 RepID=UPI00124CE941|nr:acyl-CoA carboxylase subunit epsilon [Serinicoccus kebangsaanensis]